MITASMTASDIRRVRNMDESRISSFQMRKADELKRELKRQKVKGFSKTYDFATPNAEYCISINVKHGDVFASGVFVYVKETNEYVPMSRTSALHDDCFAMSVHFIKRYAERHLKKELPPKKILSKFLTSFIGAVRIHLDEKKNRAVFAVPEGLILATYEMGKHIIHYRTFVSVDMLKDTQLKSYEKIRDFLLGSCGKIIEARNTGNDDLLEAAYITAYKEAELLDTSEAKAIYASFFEKGDGR